MTNPIRLSTLPPEQTAAQRRSRRLMELALDLERIVEEHARLERAAKAGEKLARYVLRYGRGDEMRRKASAALMAITGGEDG